MNWIKKLKPLSFGSKTDGATTDTTNPYLNARRTWNGHVAGVMSAIQVWQVVSLISLLIGLASVGGMIHIGSQSKFIPLVFQQDLSGNTVSVTRADKIPEAKVDDYRTAALQFIEHIRLVTPDSDVQRKAVLQTYAYLDASDPATLKANEYLNGSKDVNPFNRAAHESVSTDIRSVLQLSKDSWQVDWVETVRHQDGTVKEKPFMMRAIVALYQNEPTSQTTNIEALRNPHFLFIRDFSWSKHN